MSNKNFLILGLFAITLLSAGVITFAGAFVNKGADSNINQNYNSERHALMEKAFQTNDYNLWKSQMNGKGVTNLINENNFSKFAQAHRLMNEGKYDEANKIRQELGLNVRSENGSSCGCEGCESGSCGEGGCGMMNGGEAKGCGMHKNQGNIK